MKHTSSCQHHLIPAPDPGEFLAALPHLVGFPPLNSLVVIFMGDSGLPLLIARHEWSTALRSPVETAATIVEHAHRNGCSELALVAVPPADAPDRVTDDLDQVAGLVRDQGAVPLRVAWAVVCGADRWRSTECRQGCDPGCHRLPGPFQTELVRRLVAQGRHPANTREQIAHEFEPASQDVVAAVTVALVELDEGGVVGDPGSGRVGIVDSAELLLLADQGLGPDELALLMVVCSDIGMRDALLRRFTEYTRVDPSLWPRVWPRMSQALACAPPDHLAGVGAVAGLFGWLMGDGVRAILALDRVEQVDPDHNLANLVRAAIVGGVPPSAWADEMSDVSELDCLGEATDESRAA